MSARAGFDGAGEMIVIEAGEGQAISVGVSTALIGRAEWTDGAVCVLDQIVPPRHISPVHAHAVESQAAYILSGRLGFWVDGAEREAHTGGCVFRPAGRPHALWNATDERVRMLEITTPGARFQEYMVEVGALMDSSAADPETIKRLAASFGIEFFDEVTDMLCQRHGLDPRGSFWR